MSTESFLETPCTTLSPPVLDMSRCPSPCSSIRAIHTISRPNSYNAFEEPYSYAALADFASLQTPGEIIGNGANIANNNQPATAMEDVKPSDAESIMMHGSRRSRATSRTTRSRAVRRSDAAYNLPIVEDTNEGGDFHEETEIKKAKGGKTSGEKTWATSSKRWKRAVSQLFTSAKENAGILDRSLAPSKNFKHGYTLNRTPSAPLPATNHSLSTGPAAPAASLSKHGRYRALSLFQPARPRTESIATNRTVMDGVNSRSLPLTNHLNMSTVNFMRLTIDTNLATRKACNQRVRHSRSFSGFMSGDLGVDPSEEVALLQLRGLYDAYDFPQVTDSPTCHDGDDDDGDLDGIDDATREASAISRSVGAKWGYVDEE